MMTKKRRVYQPRVVGDQVMTAADLQRLHKYMVEIKGIKSSPSCAITLSRTHSAAPATLIAKA
jgi:hypothetical protein